MRRWGATQSPTATRAGAVTDPLRPVNGMIAELGDLAGGRDVARGAADPIGAVRASDAEAFVVSGTPATRTRAAWCARSR